MRPLRYIFTTPLLAMASASMAQTSAVVFDMETRRQIEGAKVYVNPHGETATDKQGRFTIEGDFHSLTVAGAQHANESGTAESLMLQGLCLLKKAGDKGFFFFKSSP